MTSLNVKLYAFYILKTSDLGEIKLQTADPDAESEQERGARSSHLAKRRPEQEKLTPGEKKPKLPGA